MEWATLAVQGGSWVLFGVAMARGWLVSRSVAERIASMERRRADEWKAAAELLQQTIDTLRMQRDQLLAPMQALLPSPGDIRREDGRREAA